MHLSPLEAIIVLLVLPTIATIVFWRLPVLRRHRVARWLLAPCVYLGVAALGLTVGVNLGWYTDIGSSRAQYTVKMEDWRNQPDVKDVRTIYEEIRAGIKENRYKTKTRNFDVESPLCVTYPIKSQTLAVDDANRPRMLKTSQIKSHRELFTVERYYDTAGRLRFVFVDHSPENVRIYLNAEGKVFWAVEQDGDKFTVGSYSTGDWETEPSNATVAKEVFNEDGSCPEIVK